MLVLRDLVRSRVVPLLGPPTSIGDFHHGMLYYLLLAPAAAVSNADPTVVTAWIALGGIVAVGVTGWLARAIGGPLAGLIAALLMAVSASAVEESTFIWNPNVIALSSSIALAASWQAWQSGRARWWVVAGAAAVVTMHCHVLGVVLSPVVGSLLLADLRLRRRVGDRAAAARVARAGVAWIVLLALSYVPLAIHELSSNASELRAAVAFLLGGGGPAAVALPVRLPIIALRVLGWPLVGLLTDAPALSLLAGALVVAVAVWCGWFPDRGASERGDQGRVGISTDPAFAVRWLALGLAWTIVALAIGASSLATVVIGLPNDHYHAFADPIVFVLVGIGLARLIQLGVRRRERAAEITSSAATRPAPIGAGLAGLAGLAVAFGLVVWNVARQPPAVAADGGWPAAEAAAGRVVVATAGAPLSLTGLPAVKPVDAVRFPLEELVPGSVVDAATAAAGGEANVTTRVILCDQLFHETIGADCGGPAEDRARSAETGQPTKPAFLIDRFEAAPGRWISVYRPTPSK
jgi:Dolichyl-phosphate-mannose-protein mannosyltransferase